MLTNMEVQSYIMNFLFILVFSLLGAFIKDSYNTFINKDENINALRIIISSVVSTVILFALSDHILSKITFKMFILPCFIGGSIGFDLFGKISSSEFWINLIIERILKQKIDKDEEDR